MRFSVLGSGSKGNAVYIEEGNTKLLIDSGFSGKELTARLARIGRDLEGLAGICLTHEHNDHIHGAGVISRRYKAPLYAHDATCRGAGPRIGVGHRFIDFGTGEAFAIGDLEVRSFRISHDTADPVGFVISNGSEYLGYCTDTGAVTKLMELRLGGCHGLILEFNHNLEMLKNGPYPLMLQQRVRSSHGHLANEDGAGLLKKLLHRQLKVTILAHLSETNNTPQLAMAAARQEVGQEEQLALLVAQQREPTPLVSLAD